MEIQGLKLGTLVRHDGDNSAIDWVQPITSNLSDPGLVHRAQLKHVYSDRDSRQKIAAAMYLAYPPSASSEDARHLQPSPDVKCYYEGEHLDGHPLGPPRDVLAKAPHQKARVQVPRWE